MVDGLLNDTNASCNISIQFLLLLLLFIVAPKLTSRFILLYVSILQTCLLCVHHVLSTVNWNTRDLLMD